MKLNSLIFPIGQLLVLFVLLIFQYSYSQLDLSQMINSIHQPLIDQLALFGTYLGDGFFIVALCIVIYFYKPELAMALLLAFLISSGFTQLLKHTLFDDYHRPLWHINNLHLQGFYMVQGAEENLRNSFPSGHTTSAFAYLCFLGLYFTKSSVKIGLLLLAFFVAFTRVYLLQHFVIDVTVGSIIGSVVAIMVYTLLFQKDRLKWAIIKRK